MRKMTVCFTIFLLITLVMPQLSSAEWRRNDVTNQLNEDVYIVYSTWRPATGTTIPAGYRTVGYYVITPGGSHPFYAWSDNQVDNAVYLQIRRASGPAIKPTRLTDTFSYWVHLQRPFLIVAPQEAEVPVATVDFTYSNRNRAELVMSDGFLRFDNGTPVNITPTWVNVKPPAIMVETTETTETTKPGRKTRRIRRDALEPGASPAPYEWDMTFTFPGKVVELTRDPILIELSGNVDLDNARTTITDNKVIVGGLIQPVIGEVSEAEVTVDVKYIPGEVQSDDPHEISLSPITGTFEPGTTVTLTVKVAKNEKGDGARGKKVTFDTAGSTAPLNYRFKDKTSLTDKDGLVKIHLDIDHGNASFETKKASISSAAKTVNAVVSVVKDNGTVLQKTATFTVKWRPEYLQVTGLPNKGSSGGTTHYTITSGATDVRITAKATAKATSVGQSVTILLDDVPIEFYENSRYLKFSSRRKDTNTSGQASSYLNSGGDARSSNQKITVRVPGYSSSSLNRDYYIRVKPGTKEDTRHFTVHSQKGAVLEQVVGGILNVIGVGQVVLDQVPWNRTVTFPGPLVSVKKPTGRFPNLADKVADFTITDWDWRKGGKTVEVSGTLEEHSVNVNELRVSVTATYEHIPSVPGAPSLQPQLLPETDQLSAVWQDLSHIPLETALLPNYPNPFNPETWIPYHLAEPANVTLSIYSADGKLVRNLALGHQSAGIYESKARAAYWDGRNTIGERVASGVYFYMLTADDFIATGKMLIIK